MIGLVIVTHGRLAEEFVAAAEHVVGPQDAVRAIGIGADDDIEQRRAEILAAVEELDSGKGVIVATDMFGSTPSNLALSIMKDGNVEVVAGVNLPMLVEFARWRDSVELQGAAAAAQEVGRKNIDIGSRALARGGTRERKSG